MTNIADICSELDEIDKKVQEYMNYLDTNNENVWDMTNHEKYSDIQRKHEEMSNNLLKYGHYCNYLMENATKYNLDINSIIEKNNTNSMTICYVFKYAYFASELYDLSQNRCCFYKKVNCNVISL